MRKQNPQVMDTIVIYKGPGEDTCWYAHSMETDCIGIGDYPIAALADGLKGVDELFALAEKEDTVVLRKASAKVQKMAENANELPKELYCIALRMSRGRWPKDLFTDIDVEHTACLKVSYPLDMAA